MSALIQNFDTVEKVIETSANSAGSALKENERYLDSIQGKIDQFNNSLQAMWSDTLDSDMVKSFVAFGTEIIKVIDNIGLLGSSLIAIGAYKGFGSIFDTLKASGITIDSITKKLGSYLFGIQATATAESKLTQVQLQKKLVNQGMFDDEAKDIVLKTGLGVATDKLTRETLEAALADKGYSAEKRQAILDEIFGVTVTEMSTGALIKKNIQQKLANSALIQYAISMKLATAEEVANMTITQLLGLGFKGLTTAIWGATKAIAAFLFTNPVGWVILAIGAIAGGIAAWNKWGDTTENLREKLSGLKSELSDIKSEIESLNGELETTQERMAELLAKDSLTFTEQEELENLQKQNDLLEREIYLLEQREKRLQKEAQKTFDDLMDKNKNLGRTRDSDGDGEEEVYDKSLERKIGKLEKWTQEYEDAKQALVEAERSGDEKAIEKAEKRVEKAEKKVEKFQGKVDKELNQYLEDAEGIDYETADEQTKKYLDYIYNTEGRLNILNGEDQAKTVEIKRIFNKEDMSGASDEIDKLVEKLAKNPGDENIIAQIGEQCKLAEKDLKAVGLSVQDATDYFTKLGTNVSFNTLKGKITEVSKAATNFESLIKGGSFKVDGVDTGLPDLFDKEGKIIQTKLSQVFQDTSDQTREDITRLLEGSYDQIKNGTVDVERLLSGFALKTTQQVLEIQNKVLGEQNLELFPNLKDEIDGIIDKFNEFSAAVGSVVDAMDTLEQARAEEAYSGSISIETLENLMKYTDDYAQLVEIDETGAITLAKDAEKLLIEQRIEKIKTDAAAAVQTAQSNLEQAKYNAKAVNETGPVQEALTSATDGLAGAWAYLGSIIGDITDGNFSGIFERASTAYSKVTAGREEKRAQVNVSVEDAQEALDNALNQQKIANALASDNIKSKYSSEEASGGNKTKEDVEKSALEKLMEDFQREMDYWENRIGTNQARYEQLQNEIDLLEAKGQKAGKEYYDEQIMLEDQRKSLLENQKEEAEGYLAKLEEGSEEWWEVANTLNDIESELDDVTASIVDLQDAIGEIDAYKFEEFNSRLDDITSKLGTIRDLIAPDGEEDWFDDEGNWTEKGVAVLGTYIQELETYKQGLAEAQAAYANYTKEYAGNEAYYANLGIHSEQELYDKREELIDQQYDYAQSISDTEKSVVDMYESNIDAVEEYTETLIDSYNDYIDSVKEALQAERDLYDFKKNVQKQSKDIAAIERRIASLSGSTNASDVAERRKLEAQLYESRESLNDTYYDHARSAQDEALDAEQTAYEETMTKFIEGLRIGLESATANMDEFLMSVTSMVTLNADTVLAKYQETELPLGDAITNPWKAAIAKIGEYDGDALELMNKWTQGGFFDDYKTGVSSDLSSPWTAGSNAADAFKTNVDTVMDDVVKKIEANVVSASGKLSDLYQQILDTEKRAAEADVTVDDDDTEDTPNFDTDTKGDKPVETPPQKAPAPTRPASPTRPKFKKVGDLWSGVGHTGVSIGKKTYNKALEIEGDSGIFYPYKNGAGYQGYIKKGEGYTVLGNGKMDIHSMKPLYQKYAKGTTGTTRDEWAITDEFGPELKMYATPEGNLSFMALGSTVVPHDLTMDLIELPSIVDGLINRPNFDSGINMISNAINKPEIVIDVENFLKVDRVDKDSLPQLEAMMDKKIDTFAKQLNYSIKKFAR